MGTAIKHLLSDRVEPSSVIFDIRAVHSDAQPRWRLNPVRHTMLCCSCTHMATVGVKGLK